MGKVAHLKSLVMHKFIETMKKQLPVRGVTTRGNTKRCYKISKVQSAKKKFFFVGVAMAKQCPQSPHRFFLWCV